MSGIVTEVSQSLHGAIDCANLGSPKRSGDFMISSTHARAVRAPLLSSPEITCQTPAPRRGQMRDKGIVERVKDARKEHDSAASICPKGTSMGRKQRLGHHGFLPSLRPFVRGLCFVIRDGFFVAKVLLPEELLRGGLLHKSRFPST